MLSPLKGALAYKPHDPGSSWTRVTGWLASVPASAKISRRVADLGGRGLRLSRERARDWMTESKASFPSQRIAGFFIVPAWRKAKVPGRLLPIRLLQGQAFGTGLHASTRLMLKAIAGHSFLGDEGILDVGAGSGILSFACLLKGAQSAVAVEMEHAACGEMRANAVSNQFSPGRLKVMEGAFPYAKLKRGEKFPLILANLTFPVLKKIISSLKSRLKKGGRLWMSGIHGFSEAREASLCCRKAGLRVTWRKKSGKWHFLEAR